MTGASSSSESPSSAGRRQPRRLRWRLVVAGAAVALAVAVVGAMRSAWTPTPDAPQAKHLEKDGHQEADPFPLTPVSDSPFENTRPDVAYVGSQACITCHEDEHESFRHTGMGRSMGRVDLDREPPDGQFDHPPSKRRYQVVRRDGRMWHRELLISDGPEETLVSEFPVKWVTGSGRHSLTYLVETDGFLVESPITWYASRQAWGMSPGYDQAAHASFQREIGQSCLVCHAGRSEAIDGSLHQMRIIEETISCERCHGPGALHVHKHSAAATSAAEEAPAIDHSIVNPAHLSRELAEAVCQQCHLRGSATVVSRGRKIDDFRPGLPLADFRQDYTLEVPNKEMTVVGHVEQMHSSRCFQKSDKFTCVTCHSPHGEPSAEQRVAHYKAVCLSCHQAEHCTVDRMKLAQESAANDCVQCHMPTSPTDIPHLAFTHHRVGVHESKAAGAKESDETPGVLQPFSDVSRLSDIDQKRSLGLAYLDLAIHEERPVRRTNYQRQAYQLLEDSQAAGLKDGYVDSALASLRFEFGAGETFSLAVSSLEDKRLDGIERCNSLFLAAEALYRQERYEEALATLNLLGEMRRHSVQWLLAAQCQQKLNNQPAAVEALLKATQINPRNVQAHQYLTDHFRKTGNPSRAQWHAKMAGQ
jgi:hypothetical protein